MLGHERDLKQRALIWKGLLEEERIASFLVQPISHINKTAKFSITTTVGYSQSMNNINDYKNTNLTHEDRATIGSPKE